MKEKELTHQKYNTEKYMPFVKGVNVISWSTNCPHCIIIREYLTWGALTSLWMFTETSRGLGRGEPVMDLLLGLIKPSSYAGANKRVKARMDFPYSGNKRLLHHPVKVRYFVVWSQGSVCSSHLKTKQRISIHSFQVSYLKWIRAKGFVTKYI